MKTDRRATHAGQCQACGSTQKLPLGVLAQHGYEVKWHQFEGVCVGHGHLPYELSAELLPGLIEAAKVRRERMLDAQRDLRIPTSENRVDYVFNRYDRRFAFGEAAHVETETRARGDHSWLLYFAVAERDGLREGVPSYLTPAEVTDALSLVNHLRQRNADDIEPRILAETSYIKWQTKRLADWKVRPLREVVEIEAKEAEKKKAALDEKRAARDAKERAKILRDGERAARLIAKFEKLVPADIRASLPRYTHESLQKELRRRNLERLPSTVGYLLSDCLSQAIGEKGFRFVPDPWKQVEAANKLREQ